MRYEYSGFLRNVLHAPNPDAWQQVPSMVFSADDLNRWHHRDDPYEEEWKRIPANHQMTEEGVILRGEFDGVRQLDALSDNDPSFWVPLDSGPIRQDRFPIDLSTYPIAEITYRCRTPYTFPAWVWHYPGGCHVDGLKPANEWCTLVRKLSHNGFPANIHGITLRVYCTARATAELEVKSIRFRGMTAEEREACEKYAIAVEEQGPPKRYDLLDNFMPMGVSMHAGAAKRLADIMEISFRDYWRLALDDIATQHHNCIALEAVSELTSKDWSELLGLATSFGIRILMIEDWNLEEFGQKGRDVIDHTVRPLANSDVVLGWCLQDEPPEHTFDYHMQARRAIEEAAPNHPLVFMARDPNAYPLFAPHMAASGIAHFRSHDPWGVGEMVRRHLPLCKGQQFWVTGPTFVYASDSPLWNTCPEMRLMLNLAWANGAKGWFSFAYHNEPVWAGGSFMRSLTGPFLTFGDIWSELGHRMERFRGMAPLFLAARPCDDPGLGIKIEGRFHAHSTLPESMAPLEARWLEGPDYYLLYVVNNDIEQVTPAYLDVPTPLGSGLEIYDATDFVRSRHWVAMDHQRHIEMFPGQGQVFLLAAPASCQRLRDIICEHIVDDDHRLIGLELGIARRYGLDISEVLRRQGEIGMGNPLRDVQRIQQARDMLADVVYNAPDIVEPRSRIIQANSAICACDGALCRLHSRGRVHEALVLGQRVIPLTREIVHLRLAVRRGQGRAVYDQCCDVARRAIDLLEEIRKLY